MGILGTIVGITEPIGELVCDQNLPGLHLSLGTTFPEMTGAPAFGGSRWMTSTASACPRWWKRLRVTSRAAWWNVSAL
jgi:hypothetical protein